MGPTAFRDGIFSASDPMSKYGVLLTTYSDGSLGASNKLARPVQEITKTYSADSPDGCYAECVRGGATTAHCSAMCYPSGPNYKLWGLVAAGLVGVGALAYVVLKK